MNESKEKKQCELSEPCSIDLPEGETFVLKHTCAGCGRSKRTEYIRSDLYATLQREVEELRKHVRTNLDGEWQFIADDGSIFPVELALQIIRAINDLKGENHTTLDFIGRLRAQLSAPQVTEEELNEMAKRFGLAVAASFCEGIRSEWISKLHQPMKEGK